MKYDLNKDGSKKFRGHECTEANLSWSASYPELEKSGILKSMSPEMQAKHLAEAHAFAEAQRKRKR